MNSKVGYCFLMILTFVSCTQALMCTQCTNCATSSKSNITCSAGQDTCMKIDFGDANIIKQCGIQATMCTGSGYKQTNPTTYTNIQNSVGATIADGYLLANWNANARHVINCCPGDYCNSGAVPLTLSIMAVLGTSMVYLMG